MLDLLERALSLVDRVRLERRLVEMVDIYSPPRGEEGILAYLERWLEAHGLAYRRQAVEGGHYNLLVRLGKGEPAFCLMGHVDTIFLRHMDDHRAHQTADRIAGLGSADMKSGVAAMLEAFLVLKQAGYPDDGPGLLLAMLVDEEEGGTGSQTFVDAGPSPEMVMIGEPTDMRMAWQHYGYCELALHTNGERVHSAIPEYGHNAIWTMMDLVRELDQLDAPDGWEESARWMVFTLRELVGENADFTVPETCRAEVDFHLHPKVDVDAFCARVDRTLAAFEASHPKLGVRGEWKMRFAGFALSPEEPLMQLTERAFGSVGMSSSRDIFRSHSDANILVARGARCVIVGPGALGTAHTIHEYVDTAELFAAARFYVAALLHYAHAAVSSQKA